MGLVLLSCKFSCVWGVTWHGTLGHHWFSQGLVVCWQQAFAWTNVNSLWSVDRLLGAMSVSVNESLLLLTFILFFLIYFEAAMTNGLPYGNLQLYLVLCCVCSWLTLPVFYFSSNCKPYTWVDLCFVWTCVETVGFVIWLFWRSTWVFWWWTGELSQHDTAVVSLCLLVVLCLHRKIYVYLKPWILSSRNICPVLLLCAGIFLKDFLLHVWLNATLQYYLWHDLCLYHSALDLLLTRHLHYWVLHDVNYIHRACAPGTWYFMRVCVVFLRDVMTFTY